MQELLSLVLRVTEVRQPACGEGYILTDLLVALRYQVDTLAVGLDFQRSLALIGCRKSLELLSIGS